MALIRWTPQANLWEPFSGLADIQEEMNRLFDTSLRRGRRTPDAEYYAPCDLYEEKDKLVVRIDLPGLRLANVCSNCTTTMSARATRSQLSQFHNQLPKLTRSYHRAVGELSHYCRAGCARGRARISASVKPNSRGRRSKAASSRTNLRFDSSIYAIQ